MEGWLGNTDTLLYSGSGYTFLYWLLLSVAVIYDFLSYIFIVLWTMAAVPLVHDNSYDTCYLPPRMGTTRC